YWASVWDADQVFYGRVLGFKGLERRAVVLALNEADRASGPANASTSVCHGPMTSSSSAATRGSSVRSVATRSCTG
ncbi:MAG: hypothetical protein ACR2KL_02370, partial [Nocardioidaceae bacterium]